MTEYEKAISELEDEISCGYTDYVSTESMELAIQALEKQIAKKPSEVDEECGTFDCPTCGSTICSLDDMTVHQYCLMCGQHLSWE